MLIEGDDSDCAAWSVRLCPTGCLIVPPGSNDVTTSQLILSAGEGYINLRVGELRENFIVISNCLRPAGCIYMLLFPVRSVVCLLVPNRAERPFRRRCQRGIGRGVPNYTSAVRTQSHHRLAEPQPRRSQRGPLTSSSSPSCHFSNEIKTLCCPPANLETAMVLLMELNERASQCGSNKSIRVIVNFWSGNHLCHC